ncbi:DUF2752 domain-containing protein [Nocardiopsis sp. MG754419]|uniref:DUF2752 domain-containing protein n=1 Tax=Nocardiopsis sp. MG754419 TaxID=2259865 RepID=UPI001BA82D70|nr:DUF2752 domain-containing protein [Nocardiopsis sp. MG754419]MBR8741526.1 DUF2752 domain-containing protein [Nocardiopsis sp. MG754419]
MQHDDLPAPTPVRPTLADRVGALGARVHPGTWPIALGVLGLVGAAILHTADPNDPGSPYPTCPWLALTGTFCPGCGTTRALAALTHLDVVGAASMNLLLVLCLPFLVHAYASWLTRSFRTTPVRRTGYVVRPWLAWSILGVFASFWVLRNLPWFSFLAPGTPLLPTW